MRNGVLGVVLIVTVLPWPLVAFSASVPVQVLATTKPTFLATTPPVITSKPDPEKGERLPSCNFTVILRAVFSSTGEVTNIGLVKISPVLVKDEAKYFAKAAMKAAKQIKFIPAQHNGMPVSMLMQLEYEFGPTPR